MFRIFVIIALVVSASACTTVRHMPLTDEASQQLSGKSVARTQYPVADFSAFTSGKAAFAVVGAAAMISEGNKIVRENQIEDPSVAIGKGLVERLAQQRGVTVVETDAVSGSDKPLELVTAYPGANFLVDVKTMNWMFVYYPNDWTHYRVVYAGRVRVIDADSQKVTAETMCKTTQGDDENPPTKEQLLENEAELLKFYLGKGAAACVDVVSKELLRL